MRFLFQAPPGLAFFDLAGVRLMLDGPAADQAGSGSVIYFKSWNSMRRLTLYRSEALTSKQIRI
jgi:hypothetical protein